MQRRLILLSGALLMSSAWSCAFAAGEASTRPPHARASTWRTTVTPAWGSATVTGSLPAQPRVPSGLGHELEGIASFYWQDQMTANGEQFDKTAMTAAHRTLPFGTQVRVTHVENGKSIVVRINDRGPFKPGRIIDLSKAAAGHIDMHAKGLARVRLEVVGFTCEGLPKRKSNRRC